MRVLVTGGTGFVGRYVVSLLRQRGHFVLIGTRGICKEENCVQFFMDCIDWMDKTIEKNQIECIIHLSACASVSRSFSFPFETYKNNVNDTVNLLNLLADKYTNIKLILASSSEVYQLSNETLTEDSTLGPVSPYGHSKLFVDCFSRSIAKQRNLKWIVTRPFNTVGVGQNPTYVFPSFVRQIVEMKLGLKEKVMYVGNIQVQRDFVDVNDVARAYVRLCEDQETSDVFNLCSGESICLASCIRDLIEIAILKDVYIVVVEKLLRPIEVMRFVGSNKKMLEKHNWVPKVAIRETIERFLVDTEEKIKNVH